MYVVVCVCVGLSVCCLCEVNRMNVQAVQVRIRVERMNRMTE